MQRKYNLSYLYDKSNQCYYFLVYFLSGVDKEQLLLFRQPLHDVLQQRVAGGAGFTAEEDDDEFAGFVFRMGDDAQA